MQHPTPADNTESKVVSQRWNRRLLLVTCCGALLLTGGIHLLHDRQVQRNATQLLEHARDARDSGEIDKAVRFYTEFLSYRPRDVDAAAELGVLLDQEFSSPAELRNVYVRFEEILRLEPQRTDIQRRLVRIYGRVGKFRDALEHLAILEQASGGEDGGNEEGGLDAELTFLKAQCYEGLGRFQEAKRTYEETIYLAPENVDHYIAVCNLLMRRPDEFQSRRPDEKDRQRGIPQTAKDWMNRMVEVGQPRYRAYLARAQYHKSRDMLADAEADLDKALELGGDRTDVLYVAAELALQQAQSASELGDTGRAEDYLQLAGDYARQALDRERPETRFYLILSRVEIAQTDPAAAVEVLEQGLDQYPEAYEGADPVHLRKLAEAERQLAFTLADLLIRNPELTDDDSSGGAPAADGSPRIEDLIRRMLRRGMPREYVVFLRGQQDLVNENWSAASQKLFAARRGLTGNSQLSRRIYLDLNQCYEQMGNPDARLAVLRSAVNEEPLWNRARLELADTLTELNRYDEAIERYRPMLGIPGVPAQVVRLMTMRELSTAQNRRDWGRVEDVFDEAEKAGADPIQIAVLRAETRLHQKRYDEASELLEEARRRAPDSLPVRIAEVLLSVYREDIGREERLARAQDLLSEAEAQWEGDLQLELARVQTILLQAPEKALAELPALEQTAAELAAADRAELLVRLARAYESLKSPERAGAIWRRLTREFPNKMDYWFALGLRAIDEADRNQLDDILEQVIRIEGPDGPNGTYLEAAFLVEETVAGGPDSQSSLRRARRLLRTAADRRPSWSAIPRAQGRLEELAGSFAEALAFYERAMDLGDRSPEIIVRRMYLLSQLGRDDEAEELTQRVGAERPEYLFGDVGRIARTLFVQKQDLGQAYEHAERLAGQSDHFWDVVWYAELRYMRGERGEQIDEAFRDAVKLAPDQPDPWLALVRHLIRTGRRFEARLILEDSNEAQRHVAEHQLAPMLARGYEMLGDLDQAEKYYLSAHNGDKKNIAHLKAIADFYRRRGNYKEAEGYFNMIVEEGAGADQADVAWARRNHALMIEAQGGYDRSIRAVDLLDRNGQGSAPDSLSDLRVKAFLLARRPTRVDRLKAIEVFEAIRQRGSELSAEELLQLAGLYESTGDWHRAREEYEQLMIDDGRTAAHFAQYINALLRHDEVGEAEKQLEILKAQSPDAFVTAKTEARYLHARKKGPQGAEQLKEWLVQHRPDSLPDWLPEVAKAEDLAAALRERSGEISRLDKAAQDVLSAVRSSVDSGEMEQARARLREYIFAHELEVARHTVAVHESAALCEELAQYDTAEELFREYAARSNRADAVFALAKFLSRRGRVDEGLDVCDVARGTCDPELLASAAVSVVGRSSMIGGGTISPDRMSEVEQWVESALTDNPRSTTCIVALADLRLMQQRLAEAETLYRRLLPENDRHVIALNNLAWLLAFQQKNADEALQRINRAIEIAGPRPDLLDTRAIIYMNKGLPDRAIADLENALEDTEFAVGYLHLAQAYFQAREIDKAKEMWYESHAQGVSKEKLHPLERQRYDDLDKGIKQHELASAA